MIQADGMAIAQQGNGNHFLLGELLLATDNVVIYDWFDGKSPAYYKGITGDVDVMLFGCCGSYTNTGCHVSRPSPRAAAHSVCKVRGHG